MSGQNNGKNSEDVVMNIYEKNMEVLNRNDHSLYVALQEAEDKLKNPRIKVWEESALNGEPVLFVEKGETTYRLNSIYNPTYEATIWSEQFEQISLQDVYILFGLGNGSSVRALAEHIKENRIILIYEPSYEIFSFVMEHYDFSDLLEDPAISIVVRDINDIDFINLLGYAVPWSSINNQSFCALNGYAEPFNTEFLIAYNHVMENANKLFTYRNTAIMFGKSMTFNSIENSKFMYNTNSLEDIKKLIPEDLSAIIVAAGPSLDKNVERIKDAKGKAIIIAVDRALDTLLAHDIMPDFSVTIDPNKPARFYDNPITWEIPMFYPLAGNRKIISRHTGPKILFCSHTISNEYYKRLGRPFIAQSPGGSVATAATSIAMSLGIKNIILVGQDLAYHNGYTHAGGIKMPEGMSENKLVKVKGIHGEELYTGWDMYAYIIWYQELIANNKDNLHIIDATEGGALIRGTEIMDLKDAVKEYCNGAFDVNALLEQCKLTDVEERYQVSVKLFEDIVNELKEFAKKSKKAASLCNDLLTNLINHNGLNNKGLKMSKSLSELNTAMDGMFISSIIEGYISAESLDKMKEVNVISKEEKDNQRKTFELSRTIYEINEKASMEILEYMEPFLESYKKIES